jgi:hypothetical protein
MIAASPAVSRPNPSQSPQVCIMLPHDPTGVNGVKTPQPDFIKINEPPAFKKA